MSGDLKKRWTKRPARSAEEGPRTLETRSAEEDSRGGNRRDVDIPGGEGYISFDGKSWQSAEENGGSRICLKAYSRSIEKESRESNGA